jgi:hypothetical protein
MSLPLSGTEGMLDYHEMPHGTSGVRHGKPPEVMAAYKYSERGIHGGWDLGRVDGPVEVKVPFFEARSGQCPA